MSDENGQSDLGGAATFTTPPADANADGVVANADGVVANADGVAANADGVVANADGVVANADGVAANADGVAANADGVAAAPVVPPECKYDGYVIKYECGSDNKTYATITKGGKELGKIQVGQDDKLNINYQNSDDFAKIIFKENASAVQSDIKNIYDNNIKNKKGVDNAMKTFYLKYGVFTKPDATTSEHYYAKSNGMSSYNNQTIQKPYNVLRNILTATGLTDEEIVNKFPPPVAGGKTRNQKRHRRRTMRKRQTL